MTINHHQYANEDAALEALKEKSEKLHAKVHALIDFVKKKLESLTPDAKKFADEVKPLFFFKSSYLEIHRTPQNNQINFNFL